MRIGFIDYIGSGIREPRGTKIVASLAKMGHEVYWAYGEDLGHLPMKGVHFTRIPTPNLPFRFKEIWFAKKAAQWAKKQTLDAVIGFSHIGGLAAYWACKKSRTPFIFDYPDPLYPTDPAYAAHYTRHDRWLAEAFETLEKKALQKAAFVTVISPYFANFVKKRYGVLESKLFVAPNAPDAAAFRPGVKKYPTFTAAYVGKAVPEYGVGWLLSAFAACKTGRLLLVVKVEKEWSNWLKEQIRVHGLQDRVRVYENVPYQRVSELIRKAHVAIFPYPRSPINDYAAPNKLFEYMALGLPVITRELPETKRLVQTYRIGICVESEAQFAHGLERLNSNPEQMRQMGARARKLALEKYDWRKIGKKYEEKIKEAIQKPRHRETI